MLGKKAGGAAHVLAVGAAFEAVGKHYHAGVAVANPVEVEEVVVGGVNALADERYAVDFAENARPKRLGVAGGLETWGSKRGRC